MPAHMVHGSRLTTRVQPSAASRRPRRPPARMARSRHGPWGPVSLAPVVPPAGDVPARPGPRRPPAPPEARARAADASASAARMAGPKEGRVPGGHGPARASRCLPHGACLTVLASRCCLTGPPHSTVHWAVSLGCLTRGAVSRGPPHGRGRRPGPGPAPGRSRPAAILARPRQEQVQVAGQRAEVHLVHAKVGEDGHLPRGQHLSRSSSPGPGSRGTPATWRASGQSTAAVRSDRNTETSPPSTRSARRNHPRPGQPNRPPQAGLLPERVIRPSGPREGDGQDLGVPVSSSGRRSRRRCRHSHPSSPPHQGCLPSKEWCQIGGQPV